MRLPKLLVILLPGLLLGQHVIRPTGVAEEVNVFTFDPHAQIVDPCERVLQFTDAQGKDLRSRFEGCTGRNIPYGKYSIQLEGQRLRTRSSKQYSCDVYSPRPVCRVMNTSDELDIWPSMLAVRLTGLEVSVLKRTSLLTTSLFGESRTMDAPDPDGDVLVPIIDQKLLLTVLVGDQPLGSVYVDRRPSSASNRQPITIRCNLAMKTVDLGSVDRPK